MMTTTWQNDLITHQNMYIDQLYDTVRSISEAEQSQIEAVPFDENQYKYR